MPSLGNLDAVIHATLLTVDSMWHKKRRSHSAGTPPTTCGNSTSIVRGPRRGRIAAPDETTEAVVLYLFEFYTSLI